MTFDPDTVLDGLFLAQAVLGAGIFGAAFLLLPWRSKAAGVHRVILAGLALVAINLYGLVDPDTFFNDAVLDGAGQRAIFRFLMLDLILATIAVCTVHLGRQASRESAFREVAHP